MKWKNNSKMENPDKKYLKKELRAFLMPAIFSSLLLLLFAFFMGCRTKQFVESERKSLTDSLRVQRDSTACLTKKYLMQIQQSKMQRNDTSAVYQVIVDMQTSYEQRLNNVLADLRQAHNDAVDTLAIHFTFWICFLALLGGVVPLVFNLGLRKQVFTILQSKETKMDILLDCAILRSEEEKFYIVVQNVRALSLLGRIFFNSDIQERVREQYNLMIKSNNKIVSTYEILMTLKKKYEDDYKCVFDKENDIEPNFQLYSTSLLLVVQNLKIVYSSRDELMILDAIRGVIEEINKTPKIEDKCKLAQKISGLFSLLCDKNVF